MAVHYLKEGRKRRIGHGIGLKMVSGAGDSLGLVVVARLQWPYVARGGEDSKGSTGGGERGGATRGRVAPSCRAAHMAGQGRRHAAKEKQRGDRDWGRRRGPGCKKQKVQGPHCKAWITFTPMLKWRST
jgi:hypothetical protein